MVEYTIAGALVAAVGGAAFTLLGNAVETKIGVLEDCVNGVCP